MHLAVSALVSILDAIVIYLSAGAPFGVLRFFSGREERSSTPLLFAAVSVLIWPLYAIKLLISFATRRHRLTSTVKENGRSPESELFVISGHPHPELASICYRRVRQKVILGRAFSKIADTAEILHTDPDLTGHTASHTAPALEQTIDAGSRSFPV